MKGAADETTIDVRQQYINKKRMVKIRRIKELLFEKKWNKSML